jgi:hypothetical protein
MKKNIPINSNGLNKISIFEFPVELNIISSLSSLNLFKANIIAKNIDIGIVIIDNLGSNRIV